MQHRRAEISPHLEQEPDADAPPLAPQIEQYHDHGNPQAF